MTVVTDPAPGPRPARGMRLGRFKLAANLFAVAIFGLAIPGTLAWQSNRSITHVSEVLEGDAKAESPAKVLSAAKASLASGNDYVLLTTLVLEHSNETVLTQKQLMKAAIMQLGFAVMSLGLMLIIFGLDVGGAATNLTGAGLTFDFKTGSSGILVFVIGAAMAAAAGLLKNDFQTVGPPQYLAGPVADAASAAPDQRAKDVLATCQKLAPAAEVPVCFMNTMKSELGTPR